MNKDGQPKHPYQVIHEKCVENDFNFTIAWNTFLRDGEPWFVKKGTMRWA